MKPNKITLSAHQIDYRPADLPGGLVELVSARLSDEQGWAVMRFFIVETDQMGYDCPLFCSYENLDGVKTWAVVGYFTQNAPLTETMSLTPLTRLIVKRECAVEKVTFHADLNAETRTTFAEGLLRKLGVEPDSLSLDALLGD